MSMHPQFFSIFIGYGMLRETIKGVIWTWRQYGFRRVPNSHFGTGKFPLPP